MNVEESAIGIEHPRANTTGLETSSRVKLSRHIANLRPIRLLSGSRTGWGKVDGFGGWKFGPFYVDGMGIRGSTFRPSGGWKKYLKSNRISVETKPHKRLARDLLSYHSVVAYVLVICRGSTTSV
jgi:hypothetical protein